MSSIHYLKVEKTARIVTSGNPVTAKHIWIIAHGYGQLATYFIEKFRSLDQDKHFVIVPEGLHRYYLNGFSGKVGASWMTKEEREKDIEDYCSYLDKVYEQFISPNSSEKIINAFGFSQGGATICRWAANTKKHIDNLIVWGSVIPPDMKWEEDLEKLKNLHWLYVAGSMDEFLNKEQQDEQIKLLNQKGIKPETIFYEGKHDIDDKALHLLTQKCVKKNS
jgi:predicted esterase